MKHTVKWLEENLGITRKTIRNYEAKGLLSSEDCRNPINNFREYDDDDIDRIWGIKLLQGVGYSLSEIWELLNNPEADYYKSISEKIVELERKREDISSFIDFAKTIKLTGMIPTTKEIGSVRFSEFMKYSRENWSILSEPKITTCLDAMESLQKVKGQELSETDIDRIETLADLMNDYQEMQSICMKNAYFQIIARMRPHGFDSEAVQAVVEQLFHFISESIIGKENGGKFTPLFFAKYTVPFFLEGSDVGLMNIANYGIEGADFIANAIAFFGGCNSLNDLYK